MTIEVPEIDYDLLSDEYKAKGIDLYDMLGSFKGKPAAGEKRTPYVNFWHQLLDLTKSVTWTERPGYRTKSPPVGAALVYIPEDPTTEELAEARKRLTALAGVPELPDEAWAQVGEDMMQRRIRAEKAKEVIADAATRYGVDMPGVGKVVRIKMTVDC